MINSDDIVFDEDLMFYTSIEGLKEEAYLILSDGLYAAGEELSENYKSQIAAFLNKAPDWYPKAIQAIKDWAQKEYNLDTVSENDIELLNVYILYEQKDKELYGLEFSVDFEEEHGCGIKITEEDFKIMEIGEGHVAFA